jgi:hypothetical protein
MKVVTGWGVQWDIQWHVLIGADSFWIPPHLMIYAGVSAAALLSFGILVWDTRRGTGGVTVLGLSGSRGFHLAAWGIALTLIAAPIDQLWHRLFGIDVTFWSPPHVMAILGSTINAWACLIIAREVYPEGGRARLAAMLLTGALLYGSLFLMVDPAFHIAYLYGGVRFYTSAILAALILPLALVPAARLSGNRWAPVCVLVIVSLVGMVGHRIALVGLPLLYVGVAAVFAMALVDARSRPVASTIAFSLILFIGGGWFIAGTLAHAPMVPGAGPTAVAFAITLAAALVGGVASRRLSDTLEA